MDFKFTPEEEAFRKEVRAFLEKEVTPEWDLANMFCAVDLAREELQEARRTIAHKLAQRKWLSLTWPKEHGGLGASMVMQFIFIEELMYAGGVGYEDQGVGMVAPILIRFGTEEQKRRHLPGIANGEVFWCQGFSEPNAGSDLASIQTKAVQDGNNFIINGQKTWVSKAQWSEWCHLLARTDPDAPKHGGISYFLIDMRTPGINIRPMMEMCGVPSLCEIFLEDVRVPQENMLGEKNGGWKIAMSLLDFERAIYMEQVGVAKRVLKFLVEYANERGLYKNPLVRKHLAQMAIEIEIGRLLCYRVAWLDSQGLPATAESAMCKIFVTEMAKRCARVGMELLGLYGQLSEGETLAPLRGKIQHWYLSSFAVTLLGGTSEVERNIIATRGLELPRD